MPVYRHTKYIVEFLERALPDSSLSVNSRSDGAFDDTYIVSGTMRKIMIKAIIFSPA
jgi:hypothetical protein